MIAETLGAVSGVFGSEMFGGAADKSSDTIDVSTGPVRVHTGGGPIFEATDSWVWLVVLALLVVALFKW